MKELKAVEGIGESQVRKIISCSKNDSIIKKFTTDTVRFKNKNSFDKWRKKGRVIYTLVDNNEELLGIIWFGKKTMPKFESAAKIEQKDYGITFAIRLYGETRGVGLSNWFMKEAFEKYTSSDMFDKVKKKGFWLETLKHNIPAIKTYKRFGFKKVGETDSKSIVMVYELGKA